MQFLKEFQFFEKFLKISKVFFKMLKKLASNKKISNLLMLIVYLSTSRVVSLNNSKDIQGMRQSCFYSWNCVPAGSGTE